MNDTLWARIDPASEFRIAPDAFGDTSTDPQRGTKPAGYPPYHPNHPQFAFGVVLVATVLGTYYLFEHGGVGAGAKAHAGPLDVGADLDLKGGKK
jgi:hypothetical protein